MSYYKSIIWGVGIMRFQKIFASMLLGVSLFGFASLANAGVMEEIKAQYPKAILNTKNFVDSAGVEHEKKVMPLFASILSEKSSVLMGVNLLTIKGKNYVTMDFWRRDVNVIFMDTARFHDGQGVFQLMAIGEPNRGIRNGKVEESFVIAPVVRDLEIIKNAKTITAVGRESKEEVDFTRNQYPLNITFSQAIEYAIRHLNENNR